MGLSNGETILTTCLAVWHNTGSSQTDGRTDRHIATAYIALCRHKPDEKTRVDVVRSLC